MDDTLTERPLLSGLADSISDRKQNVMAKKKFLRSRSAPSLDSLIEFKETDGNTFPGAKLVLGIIGPSFKKVAALLAIYLTAGAVCFCLVKDQMSGTKTNGVLDALYFSVVTMTTVGYGDLVPNSVATKLLACLFVFSGMALVALFLNGAADYLVEKQEALLTKALYTHRHKSGEAHMLKVIETNRTKYKFLMSTAFLVVLIAAGTIFLWKVEHLSFVDAFYCVCSTITTLGYGDKSFSTGGGRVFAIFWILASTIVLAQFYLYLAEWNTESRQHLLAKLVLKRRMNYVDLEAADLDDDGAVGAAEFIIYKLKEMGKITEEDIALVMEEFENTDVDRSGKITMGDLVLAQSSR